MEYSTDYLRAIRHKLQSQAEQEKLRLLSDNSLISLPEIQYTLSVLLDLRVGRLALMTPRLKEYLDDMIDICVIANREGLDQKAANSLITENYPYDFFNLK